MKLTRKTNYCQSFFKFLFLMALLILLSLPWSAQAGSNSIAETKLFKEERDDGLTIVWCDPGSDRSEIQFLTLILKTGSAHDPVGKSGLTDLTNEIVYYLLRQTNALQVNYQSYADYSVFHFGVTLSDFNQFCSQLDQIIRFDALLYYDLCNELIRYHLNKPQAPEFVAISQLYSMVYGPKHPYSSIFSPNYEQLDINEVNKWFRQIYKPNNLIIATSTKLPEDFLRRPAGRDLKEAITLNKIPPACADAVSKLKWTPVHDNIAMVCLGFETPKLGEVGVFATILLQKYLDQKLWKIIREDNGLSYDPEVYYQLTETSSVPMIFFAAHTLKEDTGTLINLILEEFEKIAVEGIPEAEIAKIIARERKRREQLRKDLKSTIQAAALFGLTGQKWLIDPEDFLSQLTAETKMVPPIMTSGLARLKISIVGPEDTGKYLSNITLKGNRL